MPFKAINFTSRPSTQSWLVVLTTAFAFLLATLAPHKGLQELWPSASLLARGSYTCSHDYSIEILSTDPLVLYINGFIQDFEIRHLLRTHSHRFEASRVVQKDLQSEVNPDQRRSDSATIPPEDPVSQCLIDRIKLLLGNLQHEEVDALQLLRYDTGGQFRLHYDWFPFVANKRNISETGVDRDFQRLATTFVYLSDDCVGGETYFPHILGVSPTADGEKFSRTDTGEGLLVKPKKGNAIFWNNMHMNGTGDTRVLHAGMPLQSGEKLGLNIFSTYFLDSPLIG